MDWANVTKVHTPPSAKRSSPLTSMRCTKKISRPGMASYKVIPDIAQRDRNLFSLFHIH